MLSLLVSFSLIFLDEYNIAAEIYRKILKMDPKNIDVTCDLSYIYVLKLDKKQEGLNMIMECLKDATEERNKAKLQTKINELCNQSGDLDERNLFEDGLGDNRDGNFEDDNFLEDSRND